MPLVDALIAPVAALLDKVIPDPKAREAARLELARLELARLELARLDGAA